MASPLRSIVGIAGAFLVTIAIATVGTGAGVYLTILRTIDHQVDRRLAAEAAEVQDAARGERLAPLIAKIEAEMRARDSGDIGFVLRDAAGRHIAGNIHLKRALPPGFSKLGRADEIPGLTRGRALVERLPGGATLVLAAESEPIEDYDRRRVLILLTGFGVVVVLVLGSVVLMAATVGRRIEAVRATADAIVDGDMRSRVPRDYSGSAFDRQAEAFNRMLDRIEALMTSLANVSSDIAHDLRTPLARLRNQLVALADHADTPRLREEAEEAVAQSDELLGLFAAILRIAEVEGGERRARFERLDLGTIAHGVAETLEPIVEDSGDTLVLGPCPRVMIEGDAALLNQLLVNLVENAVHHTPAGTAIRVDVARHDDHAELRVADNGPGIAEGEHLLALRRFGRLDRSRNRPGHGLGLPMVEAIARLHRGTLTLGDAGPGLAVTVRLPLAG